MAEDVNVQGAEPSPAPTATSATEALAALSPEQYAEWRKTGDMPAPPKTEDSATSKETKETTVGEADKNGKPGSAAESETAKESKESKGEPSAADKRKNQLNKEIRELLARRDQIKKDLESPRKDVTAEPSPAKDKTTEGKKDELRAKPKESDKKADGTLKYASFDEYLEDRDLWLEEKTKHDIQHALESERKSRETSAAEDDVKRKQAESAKTFTDRVNAAKDKYGDFIEVAFNPELNEIIKKDSAIDRFILHSPSGMDVLRHLGLHREELERIAALDDFEQSAELVAIAKSLNGDGKKTPSTETPEIKTTSAKRPGPEASGRNTPAADPSKAALANRDFAAYAAAENAKEFARRQKKA